MPDMDIKMQVVSFVCFLQRNQVSLFSKIDSFPQYIFHQSFCLLSFTLQFCFCFISEKSCISMICDMMSAAQMKQYIYIYVWHITVCYFKTHTNLIIMKVKKENNQIVMDTKLQILLTVLLFYLINLERVTWTNCY